jgi:hypothetical protein
MRKLIILLLSLIALSLPTAYAYGMDAHVRHVYMSSNCLDKTSPMPCGIWHVQIDGVPTKFVNQLAEIVYNQDRGSVLITNQTGKFKSYIYHQNRFGVYIEHEGATGNVVLNDPADGDITIIGKDF